MESKINAEYALLTNEEDADSSLDLAGHFQRPRKRWQPKLWAAINCLVFTLSILNFSISRILNDTYDEIWALKKTSSYSPLFDLIKPTFLNIVVQGSLFNEAGSPLRAPPSPELDRLWEGLTDVKVFTISREDVLKLGKDPETAVKAPVEFGFGPEAYLAQLDGQHALHCLNAVRRYAYRHHYFPDLNMSATLSSDPYSYLHLNHLSHCLHILYQTLSCAPSFDVITHFWMEAQPHPYPDFAVQKKCRDHEQQREWETQNRLSEQQWAEMARRGPGPETGERVAGMPELFRAWSVEADMVEAAGNGMGDEG